MKIEVWTLEEPTIDETRPYLVRVELRGDIRYTRRLTTEHELKREGYKLERVEQGDDD